MLTVKSHHLLFVFLTYFVAAALFTTTSTDRVYFGCGMIFLYALVVLLSMLKKQNAITVTSSLCRGFGLFSSILLLYMSVMIFSYIDTGEVPLITSLRFFSSSAGALIATLAILIIYNGTDKERTLITLFLFTLASMTLYKIYSTRSMLLLERSSVDAVTNWALIPASLFPFVFYIRNKKQSTLLLAILLISILLGNKRSGLLAVGLSATMILVYLTMAKGKTFKFRYLVMGVIVLIFFYFSFYLYSDLYLNSFERLQRISDDGGSGRSALWLEIFSFLQYSDLIDLVLGGGGNYYQVAVNSHYSSPHNDFLALFLSYGIFGMVFYLLVVARLIFFAIHYGIKRDELSLFSISLLCVFLVMSNVSGVFIYYTYYLPIFIGFAILEVSKKQNINLEVKQIT